MAIGRKTGGRVKGVKNKPKPQVLSAMGVYEGLIGSFINDLFYVYAHYSGDACFYVGKGKNGRAWEANAFSRNEHWWAYVSKLKSDGMGYDVKIVSAGLTEEEALAVEAALIRVRRPAFNLC